MVGWKQIMVATALLAVLGCDQTETEVPGERIEVAMSTPDLARLAHDRSGRVRRCYRDGLAEQPTMEGEVVVAVVVGDDGVVRRSRVVNDDLDNGAVSRCVAESLLGGKLAAKPTDPAPLHLAFAFAPGEAADPPLVLPEPTAHRSGQVVSVQLPMPKQPGGQQPRRDPPGPPAPSP